ncbi:MAG: hypothetical protein HFJ86_00465 [Oscillospiraceae bacterium]|jgi:hypothetical protein|nr:hypothetical protein [Oscillospiraceae bacterium]
MGTGFGDVSAETGNGFAKPGDTYLNTTYHSVKDLRQEDETLECSASFTVKPPVKPGIGNSAMLALQHLSGLGRLDLYSRGLKLR